MRVVIDASVAVKWIVPDPEHHRLYWTASRGNSEGIPQVEEIGWSSLDGYKNVVLILNEEGYAWWDGIQVDRESGYVYWAVTREGTIWRTRIDGSGTKELIAAPFGNITSLVLDASGISIDATSDEIPAAFSLAQNYPNPFNPKEIGTTIRYDLAEAAHVRLVVFDALGRPVESLVNSQQSAGRYEVTWGGDGMTSGVYFVTLDVNSFTETKRMLLLR